MKKVLFIASIVLLYISPLIVQSQEKKAGPYDFKGDRLGMSIQDFNAAHYHLIKQFGNTYLEPPPSCSKQIIDGYTLCQYDSSIGGISTSVEVLFTDGVLTAINLRFSRIAANLTLFTDGLTAKYGTPTTSLISAAQGVSPSGIVLFWENESSVVEFQQNHCGFELPNHLEVERWGFDMAEASRGVYCDDAKSDRISLGLSRVFFVYKPLANLLSSRVREAVQKAVDKTKSDF
jgi:hypothetical protein